MWLYYLLKTISFIVCLLPYKLIVVLGKLLGHLYWRIAAKQRIRAEQTMLERLQLPEAEVRAQIKSLFVNLGITALEIMYMPALNKDNIRGLVTFDRQDILWNALKEGHGVVMLACHMDNWEWLGAALALYGFPISAVEKPQPNRVYSDFMNELRTGVGQEIFSRGTSEILGCARAMKKGRMLGLIADQDGGYNGIFVPFLGKMASTPVGPAYFSRKFNAPVVPIFIVRKPGGCGHQVIVKEPLRYANSGDQVADDYKITLEMTQHVEAIIHEYPDCWLWFQHRWNTPYTPPEEQEVDHATK